MEQVVDVSVTELRQQLQKFLARVRRGQRLRITSRGEVIAEIAPPSRSAGDIDAARRRLRGSVLRYDDPTGPAFDADEWDMNR